MRTLLILLAALLLPAAARAAPPPADWTRVVTQTADGAYVMGNPKVPGRLIEYVSYTCSHCAHFMAEGSGPLKSGWVRRGLVAIELRNAIRDRYDLTAALLARCGGRARFFADHEALFANFAAWMTKVQAYETAHSNDAAPAAGTDPTGRLAEIAQETGLADLMAKRGVPVARQNQCLADKASLAVLAGMAKEAWSDRNIGGTPAFVLNDKLLDDVHDWASLRARLPALPN